MAKKTPAQKLREQRAQRLKERIDASLATTLETRRADPYDIAGWEPQYTKRKHATKRRSPAQLQREVDDVLRRSHATISAEHIAERRKRDPGAYSSRAQLRDVARQAAAAVFAPRKIAPSAAVIQKAKSAAFKAIQRHDPLAGTEDHPSAAYAHGIMDIAMEATEEARQRWEMFHQSLRKLRRGHSTKGLTLDAAKEAWNDDPSKQTADQYRRVAREYAHDKRISQRTLDAIVEETAAYYARF